MRYERKSRTTHYSYFMWGLSNWQDGSAINKSGGDGEWSRFREENKGLGIRWDASRLPKWRSQVVVRLAVEFSGEE